MRALLLKQAVISELNQTFYQRPRENISVAFGAVGFEIRSATDPGSDDGIELNYELSDFLIAQAVPPNGSETVGMDFSLDDFVLKRHPDAASKEALATDFDISDFEFKRHPDSASKELLGLAYQMADFEYTGAPSIDGLYHAGTTGPNYIASGISISTPAIPTIGANQALFASVYTRGGLTPPPGWSLVRVVQNTDPTAAITQSLYVYRKDSLTSGDSGTMPEWLQSTAGRMGLAYTLVASSTGIIRVAEGATATTNVATAAAYPQTATIPSLTSQSARELFLMAGTAISGISGNTTWGLTSGSVRTQNTIPENRLVVGTLSAGVASALSGSFTYAAGGTASTNFYGTIALRLSEIEATYGTEGRYLDELSKAPVTALGLDKYVTTAYHAIRVRRSSDNAEQDIGFVGNSLDLTALLTFVGSGSGYVRYVYDQTGNGFNIDFTATAARQPLIVDAGAYLDVIRMNGSSTAGQINNLALGTPYMDIYSEMAAYEGAGNITFELGANFNSTPGSAIVSWYNTDNGLNVAAQGTSASTERRNSFPGAVYNARRLYSILMDRTLTGGGEIAVWNDGMALTPNLSVNREVGSNFTTNTFYIGARAGTAAFARFDFRNLVIYTNRTIGIRTAIEGVLKPNLLWKPTALTRSFHYDDQSSTSNTDTLLDGWIDRSANNYIATSTGPTRPTMTYPSTLLGHRVATFDGSASRLSLPSASYDLFRNVSKAWVFAIYNNDLDASGIDRPILWHSTANGSARVAALAGTSANKNRFTGGGRRADSGSFYSAVSPTERSAAWSMGLSLIDYTGQTVTDYVNGNLETSVTNQFGGSSNTDNTSASAAFIGRNNDGSSKFKGSMAVLLGGTTMPSPTEIDKLFGYYAHRFDLTDTLPLTHPYKVIPPLDVVDPDPDGGRAVWNFTKFQLHFQGKTLVDSSSSPKIISAGGTGELSREMSKFFYKSYKFGGNAWLKMEGYSDLIVGGNDYFFQTWIYTTTTSTGFIFDYRLEQGKPGQGTGGGILQYYQNKIVYTTGSGTAYSSTANIVPLGRWNFLEVSRVNGQFWVFLNGQVVLTGADASVWSSNTIVLGGAAYYPLGAEGLTGYMAETRMGIGVGYHTSAYTPPTVPFFEYAPLTVVEEATDVNDTFEPGSRSRYVATHDSGATPWNISNGKMLANAASNGAQSVLTQNGTQLTNCSVQTVCEWASDAGLVARFQDNANYYLAAFSDGSAPLNAGKVRLYKKIAGTYTFLAASTVQYWPRGTSRVIKFQVDGTSLRAFINGVEVVSATDTAIGNVGKVGLRSNGTTSGNANIFESFGWTDLDKGRVISRLRFEGRDQDRIAIDELGSDWRAGGTASLPEIIAPGISALRFEGVGGSNTFTDDYGKIWTPGGTTVISGAQAYRGSTSGYFDGSGGSQLSTPVDGSFDVRGDFTIEVAVYLTALGSTRSIVTIDGSVSIHIGHGLSISSANKFSASLQRTGVWTNYTSITGATVAVANRWYVVKMVKRGMTLELYVDGVLDATATVPDLPVAPMNRTFFLGAYYDGTARFQGYMDSFSFYIPPPDVTSTTNTVSLLHLNGANGATTLHDELNITWRTNGAAALSTAAQKFGTSSLAFNGTSSFVDTPSTLSAFGFENKNFTIEMWVYPTSTSGHRPLFDNRMSSTADGIAIYAASGSTNGEWSLWGWNSQLGRGGALTLNQWQHIAVVRENNVLRGFLNGKLVIEVADSRVYASQAVVAFGVNRGGTQYYSGYIDEVRISKGIARYHNSFTPQTAEFTDTFSGQDLYSGYVSSVMRFEGINGAITTADDRSVAWTRNGNAVISDSQSKFGSTSLYLPQTTSEDAFATTTAVLDNVASNPYTIEMWIRPTTFTSPWASSLVPTVGPLITEAINGPYGELYFGIYQGKLIFHRANAHPSPIQIIGNTVLPLNEWSFVTLTYDGTTIRMFLNGILDASAVSPVGWTTNHNTVRIGLSNITGYSQYRFGFIGYIDSMRVTNGICRYTTDFTPPTEAFPAVL